VHCREVSAVVVLEVEELVLDGRAVAYAGDVGAAVMSLSGRSVPAATEPKT